LLREGAGAFFGSASLHRQRRAPEDNTKALFNFLWRILAASYRSFDALLRLLPLVIR
jgi:hypothetical protein